MWFLAAIVACSTDGETPTEPLVIEVPAEACQGADDDRDGLTDCADSDCTPICDADSDGAIGVAFGGADCDDSDPNIHVQGHEICNTLDDDCDELIDDADPDLDLQLATTWWTDLDGDGFGTGSVEVQCLAPPSTSSVGGDCNDDAFDVSPDATEICNDIDDDCDLLVDDADTSLDLTSATTRYADVDRDGFGDAAFPLTTCEPQFGVVEDNTDCAPLDPNAASATAQWWLDGDGDGAGDPASVPIVSCLAVAGRATTGDDCDDADPDQHPSATWFEDKDGDGFGNVVFWVQQCRRPQGYVLLPTDCDDDDPRAAPGIDWYADDDGDGYGNPSIPLAACGAGQPRVDDATDCDDADSDNHPGNVEDCDAADNDCDTVIDNGLLLEEWYTDLDGDDWGITTEFVLACGVPPDTTLVPGDCDDVDPTVFPGAAEVCDGIDHDCDAREPDFAFGGPNVVHSLAEASPTGVVSDLDSDGDDDVVWTSFPLQGVSFSENLGDGTFAVPVLVNSFPASGPSGVDTADLDLDGDIDVVLSSSGDDTVAWYDNLGGGVFTEKVLSAALDQAVSSRVADLDLDGDLDVLAAAFIDDEVVWFENLGGGLFGAEELITTTADGPWIVHPADLDGDGDSDVICGSQVDGNVAWYENLGGGAFGLEQVFATSVGQPGAIDAADLDGDGDTDVTVSSQQDLTVIWYENLGDGALGIGTVINEGEQDETVALTDLDNDGDIDAVLGSDVGGGTFTWYENLGGATFGVRQRVADGAEPFWIRPGDFDGNGTTDLAVASWDDETIDWFDWEVCP